MSLVETSQFEDTATRQEAREHFASSIRRESGCRLASGRASSAWLGPNQNLRRRVSGSEWETHQKCSSDGAAVADGPASSRFVGIDQGRHIRAVQSAGSAGSPCAVSERALSCPIATSFVVHRPRTSKLSSGFKYPSHVHSCCGGSFRWFALGEFSREQH
ncbi:uncharacterized protein LOC126416652 [Schistocerca serialis cubense]|uniref:uncharacterized protein LOC126416652 n=1 Tax=Schistocerca serialis cubense TaxID=2023355 RepID=UPI00214E7FFF|nr:uncharacterized protein LOC126416652 [Schistocerca serialis cubense]